MWRKAWFLPTGMWFALPAVQGAVPSVVDFEGLQFLCGLLQFPGLALGLFFAVRPAGRDVTSLVMLLCAVLGVVSFVRALIFISSIH